VKDYLRNIEKKLHIAEPSQWYSVPLDALDPTLLHHYQAFFYGRKMALIKGKRDCTRDVEANRPVI
jgi:hypothetical protein